MRKDNNLGALLVPVILLNRERAVRMHYLIAPYLLGNHFQTREGDSGRRRGNPSLCELRGFFLFHERERVCGDVENGPNVRG